MVPAAYEEIIPRSLNDAGWHAVRHGETVLDEWPIRISEVRIDDVNRTDGEIRGI